MGSLHYQASSSASSYRQSMGAPSVNAVPTPDLATKLTVGFQPPRPYCSSLVYKGLEHPSSPLYLTPMESDMDTNHPPAFTTTSPLASNVFTFTALAKLDLDLGSRTIVSNHSTSHDIAKASEPPAVALRSAFNASAPANHLAYELVVEILSSGSWSRWHELIALTHVCQHWRNVALATPQLWAEAARSTFASGRERGDKISWPRCLPVLLTRSEPFPLSINLPNYMHLVVQLKPNTVLRAHVSRLTHLSVNVYTAEAVKTILKLVYTHMRNLESLRMPPGRDYMGNARFSLDEMSCRDDADLPRLHTLAMPGYCFESAIAVASLKTVILYKGPRSHDDFLGALERCGSSLQSLTLDNWSHPVRSNDAPGSTTRNVQLPRLRRLKMAIGRIGSRPSPPVLLFAMLSLPPDVAIDIDWTFFSNNTSELLPKHLIGLHTPPFFDAMCLHIFGHPEIAVLHCYIGDTERLRVKEHLLNLDQARPVGLGFGGFMRDHQWPTVTRLAVDLDTPGRGGCTPKAHGHTLREFVAQFPNLRRLDLLGRTLNDAKLQMADAFLALPSSTSDTEAGGKTLAYVCSASRDIKDARSVGLVDVFRIQLDKLEALLASRLAADGPQARLHRLELCVTYFSRDSHPSPQVYPRVCDISPSEVLTAYLPSIYVPRFKALVDEVVFFGDFKARVPGYRVVTPTRAARQPPQGSSHRKRGEKPRVATGRKGR